MEPIIERLCKLVESNWHSKYGLLTLPFIVVILFTILGVTTFGVENFKGIGIIAFFAASISALVHVWAHRLPRVPNGKVGIIFGVICDSVSQEKVIEADLFENLKNNLSSDDKTFLILKIPNWAVVRVREKPEYYSSKMKAHLMVYGAAKERQAEGKAVHIIQLQGLIRHSDIKTLSDDDVAKAYGGTFPNKFIIDKSNDTFSFELTSAYLALVAKYVIAVAAFISGDFIFAEDLLLQVETKLRQAEKKNYMVLNLKKQVAERLNQVYTIWHIFLSLNYKIRRNGDLLQSMDRVLDKLLAKDDSSYSLLLSKAICEFMLRRNVKGAQELITRAKKCANADATWLYSSAFLHAYQGKLTDAEREYKKAAKTSHQEETAPIQAEEFVSLILENEPEKIQLYFCLGMINFYIKNDKRKAKEDFEMFKKLVPQAQYKTQLARVSILIDQCSESLDSSFRSPASDPTT